MRKQVANLLAALLLLFAWPQAHATTHAYPELIDQISHDVVEIMRAHGMPVQHDRENPWFWHSAVPGSYTLYFYQEDEVPLDVKLEVIRYCMNLYEQRGRKDRFRILMFKEHFEPRLFDPSPYFELTLEKR
jgi:hypothetical protein